jgi:hypothetical protein
MGAWAQHLRSADVLFVQALGVNGNPLFAGEAPALARDDPRLRRVPFNTRRPTFTETQRVVRLLAQVRLPTALALAPALWVPTVYVRPVLCL